MTHFFSIMFKDLNDEQKKNLEDVAKVSPIKEALDEFKTEMSRTRFYTDIPTDGELIFEIQKALKIFISLQENMIRFALIANYIKEKIGMAKN